MEEALVSYLLAVPALNTADALLHSTAYGSERGLAIDLVANDYATRTATDASLPSLVGSRIHWVLSPQKTSLPRIVLYRISGVRDMQMSGPSGLVASRVQADCMGAGYATAKAVARAVEARLSGYSGTTGGVTFHGCFLIGERDDYFDGETPDKIFRTSLDFTIWHS